MNNLLTTLLSALGIFAITGGATAADDEGKTFRFSQFNIEVLSLEKLDEVDDDGFGTNSQLRAAANIVQTVRPDVLVLNEIDHPLSEPDAPLTLTAQLFNDRYLNSGANPISFEFAYAAPCNTGRVSGADLDGDGIVSTPEDAGERTYGNDSFGYGSYPGQYSMALLSNYPIDSENARTFQKLLWKDFPKNVIPEDYFSEEALEVFRLSSKSHWDVPIDVHGEKIHLLLSHPTPRSFDGDEDKNGRRNHDEIRFWQRYIDGDSALHDDEGNSGGLDSDSTFIISGDLNCSPYSREPLYLSQQAIRLLLDHPRVEDPGEMMTSTGSLQGREPGAPFYPERNTIKWGSGSRVDYILPSDDLTPLDGGVFWPSPEENAEHNAWVEEASDHRMTWLDLAL